MQNMSERLSENAHDIWARKKKEEMSSSGNYAKKNIENVTKLLLTLII